MYTSIMTSVPIATARAHLPELIERAHDEDVVLSKRGRRAAVLVSPENYDRMCQALEDAEDVAAFDEAMAEEGPNIPWDEVKADLGLIEHSKGSARSS